MEEEKKKKQHSSHSERFPDPYTFSSRPTYYNNPHCKLKGMGWELRGEWANLLRTRGRHVNKSKEINHVTPETFDLVSAAFTLRNRSPAHF